MKKFFTLLIFSFIACQSYATMNYDVLLLPNETEVIPNQLWWTITGNCKIETKEDLIALEVSITGKGSINGHKFSKNEVVTLTARNAQTFILTAEPNAILNIKKVKVSEAMSNTESALAHCQM